jgi:hypothetical protein
MTRALAVAAMVLSLVAVGVAIAAYERANGTASYGEVAAAGYRAVAPGMSRATVRSLVGAPQIIAPLHRRAAQRNVPNQPQSIPRPGAECWQYTRPYQLNVCFNDSGAVTSVGRYLGFSAFGAST